MDQVVVNRLRFTDDTDRTADFGCIAGKLAHSIHRVISADVEKPSDVHFLKLAEKFRIDWILKRFRQLVTTGTKICTRSMLKIRELFAWKSFLKIKDTSSQKTLNSIYHTINMSDFVRMSKSLRDNPVKTAVDHGSRTT